MPIHYVQSSSNTLFSREIINISIRREKRQKYNFFFFFFFFFFAPKRKIIFFVKNVLENQEEKYRENPKLRFLLTQDRTSVVGADESGSIIEVKRKVFFLRAAILGWAWEVALLTANMSMENEEFNLNFAGGFFFF